MVTWQVTTKIEGWGMLWHVSAPFPTHFSLCISLLLCHLCYCWPLANMVPLLPRFWEHWDSKNVVELEDKYILLFFLHFSIYYLYSPIRPFPFLHPFSPRQYYLVLILPVGFSCSPCKLFHHLCYSVGLEVTVRAEGRAGLGRIHGAGGQPSPGDLAGWVFEDTRGEENKEDADLVQGTIFACHMFGHIHAFWKQIRGTEGAGIWLLCQAQRGFIFPSSFSYSFPSDRG